MLTAVFKFITTGVGFLLASSLALWGVIELVGELSATVAADYARTLATIALVIVGFYVHAARQLYELRDADELNDDERDRLRGIVTHRTSAIWAWVLIVIVLGLVGLSAPFLVRRLGDSSIIVPWMGLFWMTYSLLLIPLWSSEIAHFKSLLADRKRQREARESALKVIIEDADKGWTEIEALSAYIQPPNP